MRRERGERRGYRGKEGERGRGRGGGGRVSIRDSRREKERGGREGVTNLVGCLKYRFRLENLVAWSQNTLKPLFL
jgi:hypothetical protein